MSEKLFLDNNHWVLEDYKQRITRNQLNSLFLNHDDKIIFKGCVRQLKYKKVSPGIYEIYKQSLSKLED
jgi:hypothetical protein